MAKPPPPLPGKGLFGWLGRQVGHVARAVRADVTGSAASSKPSPAPTPSATSGATPPDAEKTVWRQRRVEEAAAPHDPALTLRRITIDEVVARPVKPPFAPQRPPSPSSPSSTSSDPSHGDPP